MTSLAVDNRFADPDAAFRLLVEAHRPLSEADSADLNARLVLILANHIGDKAVLAEHRAGIRQPQPRDERPASQGVTAIHGRSICVP